MKLNPESFSLDGLTLPESDEFNEWMADSHVVERGREITNRHDAASQLCAASFGLDLAALKYLLYDVGIPPDVAVVEDANRNALHCVSMVHTMSDAHTKSHVFALLKGKHTWLTPYIEPPLEAHLSSVLSRDIIEGIQWITVKVAQWLVRAGTPVNAQDSAGESPRPLRVSLLSVCFCLSVGTVNTDVMNAYTIER
jgi:hypothetical protein